jgi:predicted nucleic acid-binding protein
MTSKAYNFTTYPFSAGEKVLVDANIWLYLFPAPMNSQAPFAAQYSNGFARMIQGGAQPVLDPIILSEYLNRYCRIEWSGQYKTVYFDFKRFRKSPDFKNVAQTAALFARRIVAMCMVHATPVDTLDMDQAIDDFETGNLDFNDALLSDICKKHAFNLLTNDADFQAGDVEVLTTNPKLLHAHP